MHKTYNSVKFESQGEIDEEFEREFCKLGIALVDANFDRLVARLEFRPRQQISSDISPFSQSLQ
jgi:hypothetical protein